MSDEQDPIARDRAKRAERQAAWRERAAEGETPSEQGASITVHLTDGECAALDAIAAQLYRDNPHDPARGVLSFIFPGRPQAIRKLIADYRASTKVRRPAGRVECADFWRREASWRRVKDEQTELQAPVPPWRK